MANIRPLQFKNLLTTHYRHTSRKITRPHPGMTQLNTRQGTVALYALNLLGLDIILSLA